jgi:hypothetical protein
MLGIQRSHEESQMDCDRMYSRRTFQREALVPVEAMNQFREHDGGGLPLIVSDGVLISY